MNKLWIITTCLCVIIGVFNPLEATGWPEARVDRAQLRLNKLRQMAIARITRKYGVICVGTGGSMPGGPILQVSLSFQTNKQVSKSEMRQIILAFASEILESARSIRDLNEYMAEPPFDIKNIKVNLFQVDRHGRSVVYPQYSVVSLEHGKVKYYVDDPEGQKMPFLFVEKETYQDALEAVRKEDQQAAAKSSN